MKAPRWLRLLSLTMLGLGLAWGASGPVLGQCPNNNTVAGATVTPPCPGTTTVPCVQGGQYALVNVVAGNQYTFSTCAASFDTQITLYNNTGGASLGYNDDDLGAGGAGVCGGGLQSSVAWTATFTGQLRVLVDQYFCANGTTCAPLQISCAAPPPPVTNDNPCSATPLTVNTNCVFQTFSNIGASLTPGIPAPGCGALGAVSFDVWFSFVAPATGILDIQSAAGTMTDGAMALYSAPSCSGPFSLVECDDDDGPGLMPTLNMVNLVPGQTYYLRFWGYFGATGTFQVCLSGITSIPTGDCVYQLNMYDAFGDGWDGSTVGISINGGPFTNYTISGASGVALFGVNVGDILVVQYTAAGIWQADISYSLGLYGGSCSFTDGPTPSTGIVLATTVDCLPPPAPPEDCLGGVTICDGQAFSSNASGTGCTEDLSGGNFGCLSSAERQGTWYYFSPSSGGNVAFTISPSDPTDDYDFAIWGPYGGPVCPPVGPPVRCSYAAPGGDTGLNYTATDNVEGAAGDKWVNDLPVAAGQVYLLYVSNWSQSGLSFDLSWDLSNGASLDCTVLPLELTSFEAVVEGDQVALRWATASEHHTDRFVVERSRDGVAFEPIGQVAATGHAVSTTHYQHLDMHPMDGLNFYRLLMMDLDGSGRLSPVRQVTLGAGSLGLPFPNPSGDLVTIPIDAGGMSGLSIRMLDAVGRIVRTVPLTEDQRWGQVEIPVSDLPKGVYLVELVNASGARFDQARFIHP